jgi:RHS repeat-associated protein
VSYSDKKQKVQDGIVKNLKFLGMDGQILTAGKSGKIPPGQLNGGSTSTSESFQYYYHPDHLGSTSYMTDASGEVYQHLEYFAFGETFVEEHSNTDRTPYLYNGKELDEETGLYYYGARYYDARISVWLGVDPLAEKYSGINSYAYVFNNPLRYIDPTGMEGEEGSSRNQRRQAKINAKIDKLRDEMNNFNEGVKQGKYTQQEIESNVSNFGNQANNLIKKFSRLNGSKSSSLTDQKNSLKLNFTGGIGYGTANDNRNFNLNKDDIFSTAYLYVNSLRNKDGQSIPNNAIILSTSLNIDINMQGKADLTIFGANTNPIGGPSTGVNTLVSNGGQQGNYRGVFSNQSPATPGSVGSMTNPASTAGYGVNLQNGSASGSVRMSLIATYFVPLTINNGFTK